MDPTGVGARNLAECLTLQLRALPPATPARDAAMRLIAHYLDLLAARDFGKLKKTARHRRRRRCAPRAR